MENNWKNCKHWAIYNKCTKQYQFRIDESTPQKAKEKLFKKIGYDACKYRFTCKPLLNEIQFIKNKTKVPDEYIKIK